MSKLSMEHISKSYAGALEAVKDFNLEVDDKEFIVLVGPSGCGKSTVLRLIAGIEEISSGSLKLDGQIVNDVSVRDRDIAMVFQGDCLYPHLTVYDNMALGLKLRKVNPIIIDERVQRAAEILGITNIINLKPKALSLGQRSKVALGRVIVREPKVFLLDEPLLGLDAKERIQLKTDIVKLHNSLKTTFIYAASDSAEAMTMGSRLVVMKDGAIEQIDTPQNLYDNPENLFVAAFLGEPQMNFFNAKLVKENEKFYSIFGKNKIEIPSVRARRLIDEKYLGQDVIMGIRPEHIHDEEIYISGSPQTVINAEIDVVEKLGNETVLYTKVVGKDDYTLALIDSRSTAVAGESVKLALDAKHVQFFDALNQRNIMGVPKTNSIPSAIKNENAKQMIVFGKTKIELPSQLKNKVESEHKKTAVFLEIEPSDLIDGDAFSILQQKDLNFSASDYFAIESTVAFVEKYPKYLAAYNTVEGKSGYIVSKHKLDCALSNGEKNKLMCKFDNIKINY